MLLDPDTVIRAPGPWVHKDVSANGARFHVVEAGSGPLVVLLHGFPTFWWTWRHQLQSLAAAGYRVVAMDLRGYGGSDHTPHGYDPTTLSRDVAGVIRSLGEPSATVVGHGWGGLIAWSMAVLDPDVVDGIVPVSMPHPRRLRRAIARDGIQRGRALYAIGFQWPFLPERSLQAHDCARVGTILRDWSGTPGWPDEETALTYRSAFSLWPTAHCACTVSTTRRSSCAPPRAPASGCVRRTSSASSTVSDTSPTRRHRTASTHSSRSGSSASAKRDRAPSRSTRPSAALGCRGISRSGHAHFPFVR